MILWVPKPRRSLSEAWFTIPILYSPTWCPGFHHSTPCLNMSRNPQLWSTQAVIKYLLSRPAASSNGSRNPEPSSGHRHSSKCLPLTIHVRCFLFRQMFILLAREYIPSVRSNNFRTPPNSALFLRTLIDAYVVLDRSLGSVCVAY